MCDSFNVYYWGVCPVCKGRESLRACGQCKLIYYCSREHQKIHWIEHRSVCQSVSQLLRAWKLSSVYSNALNCSSVSEWNNIRTRISLCTELALGRKLFPFERQMFMFPKVCEVCKNDNQKVLKSCDKCWCVSYCSVVHQEEDIHHVDKCMDLKLCKNLDLSINETSYLTYLKTFPTFHLKEYGFPQNMEEFLQKFIFFSKDSNLQKKKVLCSELLSCPLSLLYSLKQISKVSPIKDNLTAHIVGASYLECSFLKIWNIIHLLPELSRLHIVFIGPEIMNKETNCDISPDILENDNIHFEFFGGFYHDYVQSKENTYPDVIVSFNCGFQEYEGSTNDTWRITLPFFFKFQDINIILTSYTELEAVKDLDVLMAFSNSNSEIFLRCVHNPFSSNRPHRDWDQIQSDVFFANKYISIIQVTS